MTGTLLNTISTTNLRQMPLSLDNNLPAATLRFGKNNDNEVAFSCHLDSCAAMNTGNKLLHMWIMTTYPDIVVSYEQYNDENPFRPITLDCAVPTSAAEKEASKLSAVVTYMTRYTDDNGKPITLSFGLGDDVTVNAIIGIPTFRAWKLILDISENRAISKLLSIFFDLDYKHAAKLFQVGDVVKAHIQVHSKSSHRVRQKVEYSNWLILIDACTMLGITPPSIGITHSLKKPPVNLKNQKKRKR